MKSAEDDRMPNHDDDCLDRVSEYWRGGEPLEAGRLIFESLPTDLRPKWASRILRLVLRRSGIRSSLFDEVLRTAEDQANWKNGHRVFDTLRAAVLKFDEQERTHSLTAEQSLLRSILLLAELVAKVTYNSTKIQAGGAASLRSFVDHWKNDANFSEAAWSELVSTEP